MTLDKLGNPIKVGDQVVYARSGQGNDSLYEGEVVAVTPGGACTIKNLDTNRNSVNPRYSKDLINITPLRDALPELFI